MHQTQWSPERPLPPPVSLASQSHQEKPPEVTCTSRGNPGFPASTRERPRETFFNTSRGQRPLPWLGSNDALPLATRMETRLPWRPTRGSLECINWKGRLNVCVCAQSCPTLCNSSVHGILQIGILEWVAISSSRGSSPPGDRTCVSCTAGILYH